MNFNTLIFNPPLYYPQQIQAAYPLSCEANYFTDMYRPSLNFGTQQNIRPCLPYPTTQNAFENTQLSEMTRIKIPISTEVKHLPKEALFMRLQQGVISIEQLPSKVCGVRSIKASLQPTPFKQTNIIKEGTKQILDNITQDQHQLIEPQKQGICKKEKKSSLRFLKQKKQDVADDRAKCIKDDKTGTPRKTTQSKKRDYKCKLIKRQKLTNLQRAVLINEFSRNPKWSSDKINGLSNILGLKISTIIKWNYDKKFYYDNLRMKSGSSLSSGKIFTTSKDQSKKFKEEQAFALFSIHSLTKKEK